MASFPSQYQQQRRLTEKAPRSASPTSPTTTPITRVLSEAFPNNWQKSRRRRRIFSILKRAADWASLLCLLDCTILPLLSLFLPFLVGCIPAGPTTTTSTTLPVSFFSPAALADWVHTLSLCVVVPTGTASVLWNYWTGHRTWWVAAMGLVGIVLVGWTNLPESSSVLLLPPLQHHHHPSLLLVGSHADGGSTAVVFSQVLHWMGSLLLLGSNVVAQRFLGCDCGIPFCRPPFRTTTQSKKNPLLVGPLLLASTAGSSTRGSTTPTTSTTTAMSLQTQMIHHKQQQKQQKRRVSSLQSTG